MDDATDLYLALISALLSEEWESREDAEAYDGMDTLVPCGSPVEK